MSYIFLNEYEVPWVCLFEAELERLGNSQSIGNFVFNVIHIARAGSLELHCGLPLRFIV